MPAFPGRQLGLRKHATSHKGEEDRQVTSLPSRVHINRHSLSGVPQGAAIRELMPPSTYLSPSSFMGMPQQTNTPPPASTTFTLLPHTLQRYSCPTDVAMRVLLVGF